MRPSPTAGLDVGRASTLNKKLALGQISLFELSARHSAEIVAAPAFSFTMKLESPSCAFRETDVVALFPLVVTIEHVKKSKRVPLAEVRVTARVVYRKADEFSSADSAALPDYVGIVGWMHVWPYLRAEVQSLSTKLDFPPLLLPVLLSGQTADIPVNVVAPPQAHRDQTPSESKGFAAKRKAKPRAARGK